MFYHFTVMASLLLLFFLKQAEWSGLFANTAFSSYNLQRIYQEELQYSGVTHAATTPEYPATAKPQEPTHMHSWVAYRSSMGWTATLFGLWTTCIVWQAKKYKLKQNYPNSHDHPSIFYHLFRSGSQSQQPKQRYPDLPQPSYLLQLFRWSKEAVPSIRGTESLPHVFSLPCDLLSAEHAWNTLFLKVPGSLLDAQTDSAGSLFIFRSNGSTEVITFLMKTPNALKRNRRRLDCRSTSKSTAHHIRFQLCTHLTILPCPPFLTCWEVPNIIQTPSLGATTYYQPSM